MPYWSRSAVQVDGKKDSQTDSGKFVLHVQPGKHKFKAMWFAYLRCETRTFNTSPGDTIKLNFYMKPDTTPLVQPNVLPHKKGKVIKRPMRAVNL